MPATIRPGLRLAMMVNGIDLSDSREAEMADTLAALRKSVRMLKQEGEI